VEALAAYEEAIKLDPQFKEALLNKVRVKPSVHEARAAWGDPAYERERFKWSGADSERVRRCGRGAPGL
jgi:hypothetical protein